MRHWHDATGSAMSSRGMSCYYLNAFRATTNNVSTLSLLSLLSSRPKDDLCHNVQRSRANHVKSDLHVLLFTIVCLNHELSGSNHPAATYIDLSCVRAAPHKNSMAIMKPATLSKGCFFGRSKFCRLADWQIHRGMQFWRAQRYAQGQYSFSF